MGWDFLGAVLDGDIQPNDIVLMCTLDSTQVFEDKDSDCWVYVWIVVNLPPDKRYHKVHILPGGFIPGPKKPKNLNSFLFPGFGALAAVQREGLRYYDAHWKDVFSGNLYFLYPLADGPGLVYVDGLNGHSGYLNCRMYCGVKGRRYGQESHYYPVLIKPRDRAGEGSNHEDVSIQHLPLPANPAYYDNLYRLTAARDMNTFKELRRDTGIKKPPLLLGLSPARSLGVPNCMAPDSMHLVLNISKLMLSLWCGTIKCHHADNKETWDFAVFLDKAQWDAHGESIGNAGCRTPRLFDAKPRNIAQKGNTDYKTWEHYIYVFAYAPGLLYRVLPERYWLNLCKLVRGFQLLCQYSITASQITQAATLLDEWQHEFEEIYYQGLECRLHLIAPCVHQVLHLAYKVVRKGPPICYSQWAMERTIGILKYDIRQPSNYLANIQNIGVRIARANALHGTVPKLFEQAQVSQYPQGSLDLKNRYLSPQPIQQIRRHGHLLLPNGQVARSEWREKFLESSENFRCSRMLKIFIGTTIWFAEALYYTSLVMPVAEAADKVKWQGVAVVKLFSKPDQALAELSQQTVLSCVYTEELRVIAVSDILSVVGMVPRRMIFPSQVEGDRFFVTEKPGLDTSRSGDHEPLEDQDDVDK
ncbi:hypothetical protein CONPUDRAFT_156694 [Coniophora puteana RWD-64-598 SS2]|uniref:Uncharacterized protein n=1 Tax=Coniophora puteana (strain RWD-64-598) TaxID=741705 RepID=A0A5M3MIA8_CONPW|nr:uncharacterized protein CONPUDRAFT_156694 [Coniophora puteana RWD-64-598 SS2]EIW78736.1 hypothetical protein CONPUDRAFT_156694 [Coniophora puteana RWD-64-598 SS2]